MSRTKVFKNEYLEWVSLCHAPMLAAPKHEMIRELRSCTSDSGASVTEGSPSTPLLFFSGYLACEILRDLELQRGDRRGQ